MLTRASVLKTGRYKYSQYMLGRKSCFFFFSSSLFISLSLSLSLSLAHSVLSLSLFLSSSLFVSHSLSLSLSLLSLSLSLALFCLSLRLLFHPSYYPSLLAGLLNSIQCQHRADGCLCWSHNTGASICQTSSANVGHRSVSISPADPSMSCSFYMGCL